MDVWKSRFGKRLRNDETGKLDLMDEEPKIDRKDDLTVAADHDQITEEMLKNLCVHGLRVLPKVLDKTRNENKVPED